MQFIESCKTAHQYKSRSLVIQEALELLQQRELQTAYRQASQEGDRDWDIATADGIADETW